MRGANLNLAKGGGVKLAVQQAVGVLRSERNHQLIPILLSRLISQLAIIKKDNNIEYRQYL